MDFGQITDIDVLDQIRWTLPSLDSPESKAQLERLSKAAARAPGPSQIKVGVPIWNHTPWVGFWYSPEAMPPDFLKEYSKQFSTVEVNSTFYAIPSAETFIKWKESVGPEFRFCPKFPKSVSHTLNGDHPDLKVFHERVLLLEDRLGMTFLQLPSHVGPDQKDRLESLFAKLPRALKASIEFRHAGFFENQRLKPEWVDLLAKNFLATTVVDTPGERALAHTSLSSTRILVRFLGANLHKSNTLRFQQWAEQIEAWERHGIKEVYFVVHEPDNTHAPEACVEFISCLNAKIKSKLIPPSSFALF